MNRSRGSRDGFDAQGLNTALAEAACLGAEVDTDGARLCLDLSVLTLAEYEAAPHERRVRLTFTGVSRIAASLRVHAWGDVPPQVLPLRLEELAEAIRSFGGARLHGWEYIDVDDSGWALWRELLSFDTTIDNRISPHVLEFSQEEGIDPRELDVRVWFDAITIHDPDGTEIPLAEFIACGTRWWQAHDAADPRTLQSGIVPQL
ncbi:hypothetical protein [Nocardia farcinica]|uniref:hypothetical protein n=1 Tax=Nocardia farcinica TaxID=37329 RepID=UPI002453F428|nr:hypothetical protein [Nocardia farcinica]